MANRRGPLSGNFFQKLLIGSGFLAFFGLIALPVAAAMPNCTVQNLSALGVPNMTFTSAEVIPSAGGNPETCDVAQMNSCRIKLELNVPRERR